MPFIKDHRRPGRGRVVWFESWCDRALVVPEVVCPVEVLASLCGVARERCVLMGLH